MKIVIPGTPIAKHRPRFARRGKFVTTYSDQETEEGKALLMAKEQITNKFEGPIRVDMMFLFHRPRSHLGTGRNAELLKESAPDACTNSKDLDNLVKFYLDILNDIAFNDDRQVVKILARKEWVSTTPQTVINIYCDLS